MATQQKKGFTPLFPTQGSRPKLNVPSRAQLTNNIRAQFTIEIWLCLGALTQGALFLVGGWITVLPAAALVSYRIFIAIAMTRGWIRDTTTDSVLMQKISSVFPNDLGEYGSKPANSDIVVFLLGARVNHPFGLVSPGAKEIGDYFTSMNKALDEHEEFGMLGVTNYLNASDRHTTPDIMSLFYFRTVQGLHEFAHSKYHREAWDWWNKTYDQHKHISIWHETYHVPAGNWENIYINSHLTNINATRFRVTDKDTGGVAWARPVVDASKGLLKTSAGRMSRSRGNEHDSYGQDPYDKS